MLIVHIVIHFKFSLFIWTNYYYSLSKNSDKTHNKQSKIWTNSNLPQILPEYHYPESFVHVENLLMWQPYYKLRRNKTAEVRVSYKH